MRSRSTGGGAMTTRTARCSCGRVEVTVEGEPVLVNTCHCAFCQKRSGNVFATNAQFAEDQVVAITGDTKIYNGLELDGVGTARSGLGIDFHFCATCGSHGLLGLRRAGDRKPNLPRRCRKL